MLKLKNVISAWLLVSIFLSAPILAHQQKEAYISLLFNDRTDLLEVSHRFYLHDAEHVLNQLIETKGDLSTNPKVQAEFAEHIQKNFSLNDSLKQNLPLETVGFEVDGKFFWVYQQTALPETDKLRIKHTALQELIPQQINHVNVERFGKVSSVRVNQDNEWNVVELPKQDARSAFLKTLASLCGSSYVGEMTYPQTDDHDFANKKLVANFETCEDNKVLVPFIVGKDTSRTWVFEQNEDGDLILKHDHRHADGTPDEVTLYGGNATTDGSSFKQSFPADEYTAELIPAATTNVWNISLSSDLNTLTYHLTRHDKPRFTAVLTRK